ncbi:GL18247 [Drosophila persimilis]|uniref:GL18247 n=1 Tax=Drosophila persimilis TaxID=7234 RepID=B4HD74_DROPE|nr:GL18247 [Drosophila persimilis]
MTPFMDGGGGSGGRARGGTGDPGGKRRESILTNFFFGSKSEADSNVNSTAVPKGALRGNRHVIEDLTLDDGNAVPIYNDMIQGRDRGLNEKLDAQNVLNVNIFRLAKKNRKSDHDFANELHFKLKSMVHFERDIGDSSNVSAKQQKRDRYEEAGDEQHIGTTVMVKGGRKQGRGRNYGGGDGKCNSVGQFEQDIGPTSMIKDGYKQGNDRKVGAGDGKQNSMEQIKQPIKKKPWSRPATSNVVLVTMEVVMDTSTPWSN